MKKTLVIMLALFLAIPAISYAGSATSRWDLTIGGNIKFDVGWSDQSGAMSGNDMWTGQNADRNPASGNRTLYDKYGTQLWGAGETGLNFFVKGPDAWGAKTHAFISGDFTGFWGSATNGINFPNGYNNFDLVIADMGFDWANTSLDFGVGGSFWGEPMTFTLSNAWNQFGIGGKGAAPVAPQITIVQRFAKGWSAGFGIMSPENTINQQTSPAGVSPTPNAQLLGNAFRTPLPLFEGKFGYSSDSCGKVGPWQLDVEVDGFWSQIRRIYGPTFTSKDMNEYNVDLKVIVPIIPEHNGNKAGAFYADGEIFYGAGGGDPGQWDANAGGTSWLTYYNNYRADPGDFSAAPIWGVYGHAQFYFTDQVSVNGWYVAAWSNPSDAMKFSSAALNANGGEGAITSEQNYALNLMYDVNPAVRLPWSGATR